ncbi:hypothetical protein HYFRA_00001662 [Hymenoscyphus fraxineus]|uniref:Uncharacterized protein n=1 Tax=Hymenoscyphus fraxineus TaxID=746836 RepID=A0A9N9L4A4_9HELO|nr:hypothetical protein HYFRA_00001662 [Hymenoscyphus fraxineus]
MSAAVAAALATLKAPKKKRTTKQKVEGLELDKDNEFSILEVIKVVKLLKKTTNFRWHSKAYQTNQDRCLRDYRKTMAVCFHAQELPGIIIQPGAASNINDALIFPVDLTQLAENVCTRTLGTIRGLEEANAFELVAKKKVYLGLSELIQLVEFDLSKITSRGCLGFRLALVLVHWREIQVGASWIPWFFLRAILISTYPLVKQENLLWQDLTFSRELDRNGVSQGNFTLVVIFRNIKYSTEDTDKNDFQLSLEVKIDSPTTRPELLIPHRILGILIRRKLLKFHDSIESLMLGREQNITMKPEAKRSVARDSSSLLKCTNLGTLHSLPVLLAGRARGLGLTNDVAASRTFNNYLKIRVQWLGYQSNTVVYSWRAKFGTNVEQAYGRDTARQAMGHAPDTSTLEKYYLQGLYAVNTAATLIDGVAPVKAVSANQMSPSIQRSEHPRLCRERNTLIEDFVNRDGDILSAQATGDYHQLVCAQRRARKVALRVALATERSLQNETRGVDVIKKRIEELNKLGRFAQLVREQASKLAEDDHTPEVQGEEDFQDLSAYVDDYQLQKHPSTEAAKQSTHETIGVDISKSFEGKVLASSTTSIDTYKAFMQLLYSYSKQPQERTCDLCAKSPFRTEKQKTRTFDRVESLRIHRAGVGDTKFGKWKCRMEYDVATAGESDHHPWKFPYGCGNTYKKLQFLIDHLRFIDLKHIPDPKHEELKAADGWFDSDFFPQHMLERKIMAELQSQAERFENAIRCALFMPTHDFAEISRVRSMGTHHWVEKLFLAMRMCRIQLFTGMFLSLFPKSKRFMN